MQMLVAEDVAMCFWNQTFKANGSYRTLKEEIPAFNKAIENILNAKKARGEKCPSGVQGRRNGGGAGRYRMGQNKTIAKARKQTARTEH
jgi:hypothetical protein